MSALEEICHLIPPPIRPNNAGHDWKYVENQLGLRLPSDYKDFVSLYGKGVFGRDQLWVFHPLSWSNIRDSWADRASIFRDWADAGVEVPYPVFPDFEGLLPCVTLSDVNSFCWLTRGSPDNWPIVYFDRDYGFFESEFQGLNFTVVILRVLAGRSDVMCQVGCHFESPPALKPWPAGAQ